MIYDEKQMVFAIVFVNGVTKCIIGVNIPYHK